MEFSSNTCQQPTQNELWDALERAIQEIEALEVIYGHASLLDHGEDNTHPEQENLSVVVSSSRDDLKKAQRLLELMHTGETLDPDVVPLDLSIEIQTPVEIQPNDATVQTTLRIRLAAGYPEYQPAVITSLILRDADNRSSVLKRAAIDDMLMTLNDKARCLIGAEAVMDLVETAKEMIADTVMLEKHDGVKLQEQDDTTLSGHGRRWIWVHHITDTDRRKRILHEAKALQLNGYLKHGYPGVIVVEGTLRSCDEFVSWVKGNKSRPGGFGRNWGHHVRGETDCGDESELRLPKAFEETEDLAILSSACKEAGLQEEFLEFVMQHKGSRG
jgi:hypothetical protein